MQVSKKDCIFAGDSKGSERTLKRWQTEKHKKIVYCYHTEVLGAKIVTIKVASCIVNDTTIVSCFVVSDKFNNTTLNANLLTMYEDTLNFPKLQNK